MDAAACYSLKSCWNTSSFLEFRNRYAEALTSTKIRSFKHGPFFLGGGGGGGGGYIAVLYGICISDHNKVNTKLYIANLFLLAPASIRAITISISRYPE